MNCDTYAKFLPVCMISAGSAGGGGLTKWSSACWCGCAGCAGCAGYRDAHAQPPCECRGHAYE